MRDKDLFRHLTIVFVLLIEISCLAYALPPPTRIIIEDRPGIIFSTGSVIRILSARRYPSVPFASGNKAPFPGGGVLHVSCAGQQLVITYLAYDPKFWAAQASKYGEMQRIRLRHSRPRPSNTMLDYSGYHLGSAKRMQMAQGTRVGKSADGRYAGIIEIVVSDHEGECDITSVVTGKSKAGVDQGLKQLHPMFERIATTITLSQLP